MAPSRCLLPVALLVLLMLSARADLDTESVAGPTTTQGEEDVLPDCSVVNNGKVQAFEKDYADCLRLCPQGDCPCCVSKLGKNQWLLCKKNTCCVRLMSAAPNGLFTGPYIAAWEQFRAIGENGDRTCVVPLLPQSNVGACAQPCAFVANAAGDIQSCGRPNITLPTTRHANVNLSGSCSDVSPPDSRSSENIPFSPSASGKPSTNAGKVVGIAIGSIVAMALTVAIVIALVVLRKRRKSSSSASDDYQNPPFGKTGSVTALGGDPEQGKTMAPGASSVESQAAMASTAKSTSAGAGAGAGAAVGRPGNAATANGPVGSAQSTLEPITATAQYSENRSQHDSAARLGSATSGRAARSGVRDDDLDGVSLVELDETVDERSDGGEASSESHIVPVEYVEQSRNNGEQRTPPIHGLESEAGRDIQTTVVPNAGLQGVQPVSNIGNRSERLPRSQSNISIEQTDQG